MLNYFCSQIFRRKGKPFLVSKQQKDSEFSLFWLLGNCNIVLVEWIGYFLTKWQLFLIFIDNLSLFYVKL